MATSERMGDGAPNESGRKVGHGVVIPRKVVMAAVAAQADYDIANFKRKRSSDDASAHYEAAMRAALDAVGVPELVKALEMVRDAEMDLRSEGGRSIPDCALAKITAAIAKATGAQS